MRLFGRILVIVLAVIGSLTLLLLGMPMLVASLLWGASREQPAPLPKHMALLLDLNQGVVEAPAASPLEFLHNKRPYTVREVVETLDRAAADPAVTSLVARLDGASLGMAKAQEIRDAVQAFRRSGKRAVVFSTSLDQFGGATQAYYVASAFQEIWLQPSGEVGLTGFIAQSPFLKDALDMLGVKAQFGARWEYKSAIETFTQKSFTKESRESLQLLVDSWARQAIQGIADARGLTPEAVRGLIDRSPLLAEEAQQAKLVDRLAYWDELDKGLTEGGNKVVDLADYARHVKPLANAVKVALIYGTGEVQQADNSLGDGAVMAAERLTKAFDDAAKDPKIKAILFRIDSPGGSYTAADAIWRAVGNARAAGKPVIVSMSDMAASGGYFAAMPADKIIAQPGTITGSIGVFAGKIVLADLYRKLGIGFDQVQVGRNARMSSTTEEFSPEAWQRLNASLDHIYADFTGKAAQGRHLKPEDMDKIARGRIWPGDEAKKIGLVDELGGFNTAFVEIRQAAHLPLRMPIDLQLFPKPKELPQYLLDLASGSDGVSVQQRQGIVLQRQLARLAAVLAPLAAVLDPETQTLHLPPVEMR